MCGIFGIISKNDAPISEDMLHQMGVISGLRGMDSTGLSVIEKNGNTKTIKTLGPYSNLYWEKGWATFKKSIQTAEAVIGHCRSATVGKVNKKNAQPFESEKGIFVHNGTLNINEEDLKDESDSMFLFRKIDNDGIIKTIENTEGSMAIIYYDKNSKKLSLYHDYKRPLAFAEGLNYIYIMSEEEAIDYILERNNSNAISEQFLSHRIYEINLNDKKIVTKDFVKYIPKIKTIENFKGNIILPYNQPKDDFTPFYKEGSRITFLVENIFESNLEDKTYIYMASDDHNLRVFFKTDKRDDSLLGRIGEGECCSVVKYQRGFMYQVKFRSIDWYKEEDKDVKDNKTNDIRSIWNSIFS